MEHAYSVKLSKIVKDLDVELIYSPYDLNDVKISSMDVNRPGLQLGGFFEYFDSSRIQLIGLSEYAYLKKFDEDTLMQKLDSYFALKPPVVVVSRELEIFPQMLECAQKYKVPLLAHAGVHIGISLQRGRHFGYGVGPAGDPSRRFGRGIRRRNFAVGAKAAWARAKQPWNWSSADTG